MSTPVSESTGYGPDLEMSLLGYAVAACIAVLLLPLVPFAIAGWLLWRLFGSRPTDSTPRSWGSA